MITVYHPNDLRDPELGPIVQAHLQAGTAILSHPLCVTCVDYAAKVNRLLGIIREIDRISSLDANKYVPTDGDVFDQIDQVLRKK